MKLMLLIYGLMRQYEEVFPVLKTQIGSNNIISKIVIVSSHGECSYKGEDCNEKQLSQYTSRVFNASTDVYFDDSTHDPWSRFRTVKTINLLEYSHVLAIRADAFFTRKGHTLIELVPSAEFALPNINTICKNNFDLNLVSGSYHTYQNAPPAIKKTAFLGRDWDYGFLACEKKGVVALNNYLFHPKKKCSDFKTCPSTPPPKYEFYPWQDKWSCRAFGCNNLATVYPATFGTLTNEPIYLAINKKNKEEKEEKSERNHKQREE